MNDNDDLDRSYEHTREAELHRDARLWRENARALWAVRVLDRKLAKLPPLHSWEVCRFTDGYGVTYTDPDRNTVDGVWDVFEKDSEDAARIAAADALVAEDPSLGEGLRTGAPEIDTRGPREYPGEQHRD